VRRVALVALLAALVSVASANEPLPAVPFLRVDTARHGVVHALALDEVAGRVCTA
jgi:hypothetical protein